MTFECYKVFEVYAYDPRPRLTAMVKGDDHAMTWYDHGIAAMLLQEGGFTIVQLISKLYSKRWPHVIHSTSKITCRCRTKVLKIPCSESNNHQRFP